MHNSTVLSGTEDFTLSGKKLTRFELVDHFSKQLFVTQSQASLLIEIIIQQILVALSRHPHLKLSTFGTFLVHEKKERVGRNPKTGVETIITARRSISFRASQILKARILKKMKRHHQNNLSGS